MNDYKYIYTTDSGKRVNCKIVSWDDKTERFKIVYFRRDKDSLLDVYHHSVPYSRVSDWTWQSLANDRNTKDYW